MRVRDCLGGTQPYWCRAGSWPFCTPELWRLCGCPSGLLFVGRGEQSASIMRVRAAVHTDTHATLVTARSVLLFTLVTHATLVTDAASQKNLNNIKMLSI